MVEINQQQINLREIRAYSFVAPTGTGTRKFILRIGGEKEGTTTVSRTFSANWNLCSIPLLLINPDPEIVFSGVGGQLGRISRFIDGRMVASGVYFFIVENEGSVKKTGKLAVIR